MAIEKTPPGNSSDRRASLAEPWGRRLWIAAALVGLLAVGLESYGIASWPMADDEVPSLVELGLLHIGAERFFSVPADQVWKLPRATPFWNATQRIAIAVLPKSEISYRIPSVVYGVILSLFTFVVAARWRGLWFAAALVIMLLGSELFLLLTQLNRFYSLPLLLLAVTFALMWWPKGRTGTAVVVGILTVMTVLSHNVTVAVFGLTFVAAVLAFAIGCAPFRVVVRSGVAAVIGALLYFLYLRPLVMGWHSTGNPTPVLISFAAQAGIPALALALFGSWLTIVRPREQRLMLWCVLIGVGSMCLFLVTHMTWSPRYFLFFLPALWLLAAHGMEFVARRLGSPSLGAAWYGAVIVLLLPGIASHFQDGSRHDYRRAAAIVAEAAGPGAPILSDDAETISYYLPADLRPGLEVRTRVTALPQTEFFMVCRSNVWMRLPEVPNRRVELLAEIYRRRFDEFSHVLRVYRVAPAGRDHDGLRP